MSTLEDIAEPFHMVGRDMRIELLLEYADKLPPLDEEYHSMRDAGLEMVHECQSPVFLHVEVNGDEQVHLHAHVPREAPTARAFVSILHEAFDGVPAQDVIDAPDDILHKLGLSQMLGMQRTQGLSAVYQRLRNETKRKLEGAEAAGETDGEAPGEGHAEEAA
jgi:cysteine desulfuration protein SufE